MLSPVTTGVGDHLQAGISPRYESKPTRLTQPCIPPGALNRVPASIGWGKGGNVTSAIWHASSCSSEVSCKLLYMFTFTFIFYPLNSQVHTQHWRNTVL